MQEVYLIQCWPSHDDLLIRKKGIQGNFLDLHSRERLAKVITWYGQTLRYVGSARRYDSSCILFFVNVWTELSNQFWHFWGNPGELTFVIVILTFMDYVEPYHTASWPDRYRPSQEITNLQWLLWGLAWTLRN